METAAFTILTLIAFAANSVLCRVALRNGSIDPASFTAIRLASGAAMLLLVTASTRSGSTRVSGSWTSAVILFAYAVPFSLAYVSLPAGTGALILFGCVQMTMMSAALWRGERPHAMQWLGLAIAMAGLVGLVLPGLAAPSPAGAGLMAMAGVGWGAYSLRGRGSGALAQTTSNFVRSLPLAAAVTAAALPHIHIERAGAVYAVTSGALTSGLGYVIWYRALRGLSATRAAVVQLAVPVLAAAGGVLFLGEVISLRLVASSAMVLGGIALALLGRERAAHAAST
jgi:drug/metabolite transporter (DMT)-like permease